MKINKHFYITFSHKFPNSDIISIAFGTEHEIDSILDNAPEDEVDKLNKALATTVYKSTKKDIHRLIKQDELIREVMKGIEEAIKTQKDDREAAKILENEDE